MALSPKYLNASRVLAGSTVEFTNSSGVYIDIEFRSEAQLADFEMYHKRNLELQELKKKLAKAIATPTAYEFETVAYDEDSKVIMEELRQVAVNPSWANKCSSFTKQNCSQTLKLWQKEATSMPFQTLLLAESVVFKKTRKPIQIQVDVQGKPSYTGIQDSKFATILGLGPSGCGKSFLANQIFGCISFVQTVVALDGGISRTCSNVYQMATAFHAPGHNISDWYDVFKSTADTKKTMTSTLMGLKCSLYLPDTLVSAVLKRQVNELKKLTSRGLEGEQPYVGMLIMQHCKSCGIECPYKWVLPSFQCVGCDVSGKSRALVEGKEWENKTIPAFGTTFTVALNYGYKALFTDEYEMKTKYPIFIHNAGKEGNVSILAHDLRDQTINLSLLNPSVFRVLPIEFLKEFAPFETALVQAVKTSVKMEFKQAVASNITKTAGLESKFEDKSKALAALGERFEDKSKTLETIGSAVKELSSALSGLTQQMNDLQKEVASNKSALAQLQPKPLAEVQTGPATKKWWRFGFGGKRRMRTKKIKRSIKKSK